MNWEAALPVWVWWALGMMLVAGGQELRVHSASADASAARSEASDARSELSSYRLEVSERDRRAAAQSRQEEQRQQGLADAKGKESDDLIKDLQDRAASAESHSIGMRLEIDRLRDGRAATCDTITTQQRTASTASVDLLGRLLEESDRMAGIYAEALGRSRISGLACEAIVDGIRNGNAN